MRALHYLISTLALVVTFQYEAVLATDGLCQTPGNVSSTLQAGNIIDDTPHLNAFTQVSQSSRSFMCSLKRPRYEVDPGNLSPVSP